MDDRLTFGQSAKATEDNKWIVDIKAITGTYPVFTTMTLTNRQTVHIMDPGTKQVNGRVNSYPTDRPGTNFIISFDLETEYKFTGDHAGVITDSFAGDVTITYRSIDDFVATPAFVGSVGKNQFHIEIDTENPKNKVIVDGPVTSTSKHSVPIAGGGIWSQ